MLETLRIQNFKSWQDTGDMQFGSLTGFFGTNSSGKSSILQFLLMLKQTVESSDRSQVLNLGNNSSYVELGTMHDILHQHENPSKLSFKVDWKYTAINMAGNDMTPINLSFSSCIGYYSDKIFVEEFEYKFIVHSENYRHWIGHIKRYNTDNKFYYTLNIKDSINIIPTVLNLSKPSKFYLFPSDIHLTYEDGYLIESIEYKFEEFFKEFYYLGPLREYPSRLYLWGGEQPESVGNRGEKAVAALLASRQQGPTIDMGENQPKRTVEEHVAYWLKELGMIHSFVVQPIAPNRKEYEVRIQRTAESASVFLTDVGFGISQILPVLVLLFYVPEGSTVILEQPEIHLHPAVQAGLADVFIDAIKRRRVQIILESHSEHLVQRLQRRMAEFGLNSEKEISPDAVKLYFTFIAAGHSQLTPLELDEYGNIRNWPAGFFGDTLGEAAAMMEAEMQRRMQQ